MSLQVCHCGWSKITSYHGLRTHQGKMGCTPRGMRITESDQFLLNRYVPSLPFMGPTIMIQDPFEDIFSISMNSRDTKSSSDRSLQLHHGFMGGAQKGTEKDQFYGGEWRNHFKESNQKDNTPVTPVHSTPVKKENVPLSANLITQTNPAVMEIIKTLVENQQLHGQIATNVNTDSQISQTFTTDICSAAPEVKETENSLFGTPQHPHQTTTNLNKARRVLDFSTGAQQVVQPVFEVPTTTAQETAVIPKDIKREKKDKAQKVKLKAKQDRMRAELQQNIQIREHKVDEVMSSVKACKGSLDAEWLEINNVFTEVMKIVEDARQKALQPLEERRRKVKKEAQTVVQKLEQEVSELKHTIDELDKDPDLQVCPQTGLSGYRNWKNVGVDTSSSFGSLRTTTSAMMEQIHNELENLAFVELKRIPTFAVDVRLDPATAHACLDISDDGKEVRDGGKSQKAPVTPGRFDMFGSILALDGLTSGKSYWEVEVSNKTGWDLGVARGNANRKGKLLLNPDNGYWVTVHYDDKRYAALSVPPVSLSLREKPQKVGVFVDYEEGLVSFYDVTAQSHIYSFTECSFRGEIFPYFSPHLNKNGKNSDPLIISTV